MPQKRKIYSGWLLGINFSERCVKYIAWTLFTNVSINSLSKVPYSQFTIVTSRGRLRRLGSLNINMQQSTNPDCRFFWNQLNDWPPSFIIMVRPWRTRGSRSPYRNTDFTVKASSSTSSTSSKDNGFLYQLPTIDLRIWCTMVISCLWSSPLQISHCCVVAGNLHRP